MKQLDSLGADELALAVCGLTEEQVDQIDDVLAEKFNISMDDFAKLASSLILLTPIQVSPLTAKRYHAFVRDEGDGISYSIAKMEVE